MDPSFGGGVFLRSACHRLARLGGEPAAQIFGVEIDPQAHAKVAEEIPLECGVNQRNLWLTNFFELDQHTGPLVDVVVGNPPFIRYQRFSGEVRRLALRRVAEEGVRLTELTSSWAPFVVHSVAMLRQGGRLALVVPMEIGHAAYARPVLDYLSRSFERVTFLTFRRKLFPALNEDTLLLLAENKGLRCAEFLWRDLSNADLLSEIQRQGCRILSGTQCMNTQALSQGQERLIEYFLPKPARDLYRQLRELPLTQRLGVLADVGIGYVTGANDYFHLGRSEIRQWDIPPEFLRPAVCRSRALSGLRFTREDLDHALKVGEAGFLLAVGVNAEIPEGVRRYLDYGEKLGVPQAYKCRTRSPWFRVPHVYLPDAFLSYMSGTMPRLVANDAGVVAPNTLHILRLHPLMALPGMAIAALWQTSLARLSVEIEGHALGGGMLKLEPTEAENVVLPTSQINPQTLVCLGEELDGLVRMGDLASAQALADSTILKDGLGLGEQDCRLLRIAADILRYRRSTRSAAA